MTSVVIPAAKRLDIPGVLAFEIPAAYYDVVKALTKRAAERHASYMSLRLGLPRKPRTTGRKSQNTKIHGIVDVWVSQFGNDHDTTYHTLKRMAMNDGEYPFDEMFDGGREPRSETKLSTVEAARFIEWLIYKSAEWGVPVPQGDDDE